MRLCRKDACWLASYSLFSLILITPWTTRSEVAPPTTGWALPHQPLIKKMPYNIAIYSPYLQRHFISVDYAEVNNACMEDSMKSVQHLTLKHIIVLYNSHISDPHN